MAREAEREHDDAGELRRAPEDEERATVRSGDHARRPRGPHGTKRRGFAAGPRAAAAVVEQRGADDRGDARCPRTAPAPPTHATRRGPLPARIVSRSGPAFRRTSQTRDRRRVARLDAPRYHTEAGVAGRRRGALAPPPRGIAPAQLRPEVLPFVRELPRSHRLADGARDASQLAQIEVVATRIRFAPNHAQIRVDGGDRIGAAPKSFELRVVAIPTCLAAQNGAGQQPLTPQRHEPFSVEVAGIDRPKPDCLAGLILSGLRPLKSSSPKVDEGGLRREGA